MSFKMTNKKIAPVRKYETAKFKVEDTPLKCQPKSMPVNLTEEKEKFLRSGKAPKFEIKDRAKLDELASKTKNQIRFNLLGEAQYVLDKVYDTYGNGEYFLEHAFGTRITKETATPMVLKYIEENNLTESMKIHWCDNMACSAKLVWTGPVVNANRPDLRKYSLWINGSEENNYMRECGIYCLLDHEIGTHFFRSFNDGFQPWFSERERFGLRKLGTFEGQCTEEGLAAINTILRGKIKFLWGAALAYYTACKASEMTFKQLFDHLGHYTSNREYRWKQAMRVKRGLADPNDLGGFGNDQCYFEGAVTILRNMDKIDFYLMMTGKVCHDELDRIKRMARKDVIHFPMFMKNMAAYRKTLGKMVNLNGLNGLHPQKGPSESHSKRLNEKRNGKKGKKVRSSSKHTLHSKTIASNKQVSAPAKSERVEDVENIECSEPFHNLHRRKKESVHCTVDNIFNSPQKLVKSINKLSEGLASKDVFLVEHIQRLQDIVDGHSWVCEDEMYKHNLMKDAEEQIYGSTCDGTSRSQSQASNQETGSNPKALGNHSVDCEDAELSKKKDTIFFGSSVDPSMHSSDHHSQMSNYPISGNKNCNKRSSSSYSLADDSYPILDTAMSSKEHSYIAKNKHDVNGLLQKRRLNSKQANRQILNTSVADLTTQDSMMSEIHQQRHLGTPRCKKRISLNPPRNADYDSDQPETEFLSSSCTSWSAQLRPYRFETESKLLARNVSRRSDLSASRIHIDFLDMGDVHGGSSKQNLMCKERAASQSASNISSEVDFESCQINNQVFESNGNRRMQVTHRSQILSGIEVLDEKPSSTTIPQVGDVKGRNSYTLECSDMQKGLGLKNYYQPLIISPSKPLIQKVCDFPKKKIVYSK